MLEKSTIYEEYMKTTDRIINKEVYTVMRKPLTDIYEDYFYGKPSNSSGINFEDYYLGDGRFLHEHLALTKLMQHGWIELEFGIKGLDGITTKVNISGLDITSEQILSDILGHLLGFHEGGVETWIKNNGGEVKQNREHINSLNYNFKDFYENGHFNILAAVQRLIYDNKIDVTCYDEYEKGDCTTLDVNANDVWAWAASMSHELPNQEEIESLLRYHFDGKAYSTIRWLCYIENEKPQWPWVAKLKEAGVWDETLESLRPNYYDTYMFWSFSSIPELGLQNRQT